MVDEAKLIILIEPVVRGLGFDLVRVQLSGNKDLTLQVMAERAADGQLHIDECAAISRALSDVLDAADPIVEPYRLEVSSPGIDRPLTRVQDFAKWAGFEAKVAVRDMIDGRKRFQGRLAGIDEDMITIIGNTGTRYRLPFAMVESAKLVITNDLLEATKPQVMDVDADGNAIPVLQ